MHRRMRPVLRLNPSVCAPAASIGPIRWLGYQPLKAELAGLAEKFRADFPLLIVRQEDALWPARKEPLQVRLAHRQRQIPQVVGIHGEEIEGQQDFRYQTSCRSGSTRSDDGC